MTVTIDASVWVAAAFRLRAADAIYVAEARRHDATLVTLDMELRTRCGDNVRCRYPDEWSGDTA